MKKIFISLTMTFALMLGISSCSCNKDEGKKIVEALVEWSGEVKAEGEGRVKVGFPSGAVDINGNGLFDVYTSSDTLFKATPNAQVVSVDAVLGAPKEYSEEDVLFATVAQSQLEGAFNVDVLEGTWAVDIELYARQPQSGLVFVFTRHWPEDPENPVQ